jgi:DNA-binding LytR/AlgR family response regulator
MKRIAIIDDETHARLFLRTLLGQLCPEVEVVGEADGVGAGLQLIRQTRPDAVLLDISMEDGSGFDLLEFFPQLDFKVIFTTAHDEFALRAFHFAAIDYLLKPIQPKDLMRAVDRVREMPMLDATEKIKSLLENARQHRPITITIHTQEGITLFQTMPTQLSTCWTGSNLSYPGPLGSLKCYYQRMLFFGFTNPIWSTWLMCTKS